MSDNIAKSFRVGLLFSSHCIFVLSVSCTALALQWKLITNMSDQVIVGLAYLAVWVRNNCFTILDYWSHIKYCYLLCLSLSVLPSLVNKRFVLD